MSRMWGKGMFQSREESYREDTCQILEGREAIESLRQIEIFLEGATCYGSDKLGIGNQRTFAVYYNKQSCLVLGIKGLVFSIIINNSQITRRSKNKD